LEINVRLGERRLIEDELNLLPDEVWQYNRGKSVEERISLFDQLTQFIENGQKLMPSEYETVNLRELRKAASIFPKALVIMLKLMSVLSEEENKLTIYDDTTTVIGHMSKEEFSKEIEDLSTVLNPDELKEIQDFVQQIEGAVAQAKEVKINSAKDLINRLQEGIKAIELLELEANELNGDNERLLIAKRNISDSIDDMRRNAPKSGLLNGAKVRNHAHTLSSSESELQAVNRQLRINEERVQVIPDEIHKARTIALDKTYGNNNLHELLSQNQATLERLEKS
jgi:FtsZ-binding cell division protein ZapB